MKVGGGALFDGVFAQSARDGDFRMVPLNANERPVQEGAVDVATTGGQSRRRPASPGAVYKSEPAQNKHSVARRRRGLYVKTWATVATAPVFPTFSSMLAGTSAVDRKLINEQSKLREKSRQRDADEKIELVEMRENSEASCTQADQTSHRDLASGRLEPGEFCEANGSH